VLESTILKACCLERWGGTLLFTELSRGVLLGNPYPYARIGIRYRSVGKRACSPGFREEFFSETGLPALPSRGLLLGKSRSLPFFYAPDPSSPRSSCRHSFFNAVPPIRQRFSWPRRVSHTIAPQSMHMDARNRSSTGYHVPPRLWPRLPAVSSHLASALWYCWASSIEHIVQIVP